MFDKVLQFSQENYGYQHKKEQGEQTPVTRNAEESFPSSVYFGRCDNRKAIFKRRCDDESSSYRFTFTPSTTK